MQPCASAQRKLSRERRPVEEGDQRLTVVDTVAEQHHVVERCMPLTNLMVGKPIRKICAAPHTLQVGRDRA